MNSVQKLVLVWFVLVQGWVLSSSVVAGEPSAPANQLALDESHQQVQPDRSKNDLDQQNPQARLDLAVPGPLSPEPLSKDQVLVDLSVRLAQHTEGS